MQLHELKSTKTRRSAERIGRGGKRGKTSGRGHKGQKARAGNSSRPEMRDQIKRLPKRRGHGVNRARTVNVNRVKSATINLVALERLTDTIVSPQSLVEAGLISKRRKRIPPVKILGQGEITRSFRVVGCSVSATARDKIERAGGSVKAVS